MDGKENHVIREVNLSFCNNKKYVLIQNEQFVVECNFNNGMCGQHECQEYVVGSRNISECVCNEGFQSANIYEDCKGNLFN